jgi:hypothetical protein
MFLLSPLIYLLGFLWREVVIKPYTLAAHVAHLLYPVTLFCLAAVFCGAVIGGFAGFAAEACSSLIISATWGPEALEQNKKKRKEQVKEVIDAVDPDAQDDDDDNDEEEEEEYDLFHHFEVQDTGKGKEPMRPRMSSWRDSFTSSTSTSKPSPSLIRRMKMSSTTSNKEDERKSSWEWEDDDFGGGRTTITKKPLM